MSSAAPELTDTAGAVPSVPVSVSVPLCNKAVVNVPLPVQFQAVPCIIRV